MREEGREGEGSGGEKDKVRREEGKRELQDLLKRSLKPLAEYYLVHACEKMAQSQRKNSHKISAVQILEIHKSENSS